MFDSIEDILTDLQYGKPIILVDDENRENEGDIVLSANLATYEWVQFTVNLARGLICVTMDEDRAKQLNLPPMTLNNTDIHQTAFTVSVDTHNTTTGISVQDRLNTILALGDPKAKDSDFRRPGHIFPLIAKNKGLMERQGHTEGSVALLKMAGIFPVGVICEILNQDGTMARLSNDLIPFAKKYSLKMTSIQEVIQFQQQNNRYQLGAEAQLPTEYGQFNILVFQDSYSLKEYPVLTFGNYQQHSEDGVLVRIHSSCVTGDVFHSVKCDCGEQLQRSMELIAKEKSGIIIYLDQEGRGVGLLNKIKAYEFQEQGFDTVEANIKLGLPVDNRNYDEAIELIHLLKVKNIRLITSNPLKIEAVRKSSIILKDIVKIPISYREERTKYLETKEKQLGHL